jgi:ATP-dependent helicase/nuclease subunit B
MPQPERVFLDWSEATAPAAARALLASRAGRDLSDLLVLVPTQQAARRLREELARSAPGGLLSPEVLTPSRFLEPQGSDLATPVEATLTFLAAFQKQPEESLAPLFPHGVPFRTFGERLNFSRAFFSLRASLADAGLDLSSASRMLADHAEADRWSTLAQIEGTYLAALRRLRLKDRETTRLAAPVATLIPEDVREIALVGVADLTPLAERVLSSAGQSAALRVYIPAPPELADCFDVWGRPLVEQWRDRTPDWDDFEAQVHLCARGDDVAATLSAILPSGVKPDPAYLEVGALDRTLLPSLRRSLEATGGTLHDPEGQSLDRHWLGRLIGDLSEFLATDSFSLACGLLRDGAVGAWLTLEIPRFDLAEALTEADKLRADFFPSVASGALSRCKPGRSLRRSLDRLLTLRSRLLGPDWIGHLSTFINAMAAGDPVADVIVSTLDQIEPQISRHPDLTPSDWLRLARTMLSSERTYAEPEPLSIEASGWLELPWSGTPHLVLAGFNHGIVPARFAQDPFLFAGIRQRLGLPTEQERSARDAYFLSRVVAMRRQGSGRVDVLVCQIDGEGTPGQPSPLLFAGSGDALPHRVQRLFVEPHPAEADPPWEASWRLDPPLVSLKPRLRVTGFREYLACPFEFYLRFGLEMEAFDPEPNEMDARVFGTLVHDTLELFSKTDSTCDLSDAAAIRGAVSGMLDKFVDERFETPLSLPLLVQVESARARLMAFADAQAIQRREGWRIREAEITFFDYLGGRGWLLDGWEIRGKIDRIDFHEASGRWRVLDYKTSDKSEPPAKAHIRGGSPAQHVWPPDYALVDPTSERSPKWWSNLQLPLYRQLLIEAGHDPGSISCGYFNLPKAVSAAGVSEWPDFDEALGDSALRCARGVIADLTRGRFWPPNPRARYPQNAGWFHPDPERTVAPDSQLRSAVA